MNRWDSIRQVSFAGGSLGLVTAVRVLRSAEVRPAGGDGDAFDTSVQLDRPAITVELATRSTDAAEALALGDAGELALTLEPARQGQPAREVRLAGAVLVGLELVYHQTVPAEAHLRFRIEAAGPGQDPFSAAEVTP